MEFFDVIQKRRSIRRFTPKKVPSEVINKALDAALLAPNSSNMQPWEFYWVRDEAKKKIIKKACFSQLAARTGAEIVVAVTRRDVWRRNQELMLEYLRQNTDTHTASKIKYYTVVIPLAYLHGWFSVLGPFKKLIVLLAGISRPMPRGPFTNGELFSVLTKTTALACENFMLAITAQGFATCPMEGFDEVRVKKVLGLGAKSRVVMCIAVGEEADGGALGEQLRWDRDLFVHEV